VGVVTPASAPQLRSAAVIAVGSEMLGSTRLDTNSLVIADRLAALGIELRAKSVVGDRSDDLAALFRQALSRFDLVVLTGGLGPTDDDLTREVVAGVLGLPLAEDPAIVERIASRFSRRGLRMPAINRKQAMVPRGAVVIDNPNGTAPGLLLEHEGRVVLLMPGPPREMGPMLDVLTAGPLRSRASDERLYRTTMFIAGRTESHVEERVQPIYSTWRDTTPPIETTILASPGQIELHLTLRSRDAGAAERQLADACEALREALGDDVFSTDGRSMEEIVGAALREGGLTIAAAESCTGGLMLSRLTDVAGSSEYVIGGAVAYGNQAKTALAGVPEELIRAHGAVSEPVAVALAEGIKARLGADVGVGITGIAGPGGGSAHKPVGTVAIAVVAPRGPARVRTFRFPGGRAQIKFQASQSALDMVRRVLRGAEGC
jgi:nicotinamide-nucleotide amidase